MNLSDALAQSAARLPSKPALRAGEHVVSYADLDAAVDRAAATFQRLGLRPGERVALLLPNTPAFVEVLYGAWRAGLAAVPVNTEFTAREVGELLEDAAPAALVVGGAYLPVVEALRGTLPQVREVLVVGAEAPEGTQRWADALDAGAAGDGAGARPGRPTAEAVAAGAIALLQYTSGTSGSSKGAILRHAHLSANHDQMRRTNLRIVEQDVALCVLPLFHIYALNVALALPLAVGATVVLVERFDPLGALELVERERISVIAGAPPMYVAWVNVHTDRALDLSSVRIAVSGAAALPVSVLEAFRERYGIDIWEGYGLTETAPAATSNAMLRAPLPGSVGAPLPDVEVRIVDDQGRDCSPGDPGEVLLRGPNVFSGYWGDEDATREVLDEDGWFATGDVGYLDGEVLYLVDRLKDLVIVSGFNVYPSEVEEVLARHPRIAAAAVVGVPHPATGEAVKAFVQPTADGGDLTADEVLDHARRHLARFKCPETVEFVRELPLLATGKLQRRRLRSTADTA